MIHLSTNQIGAIIIWVLVFFVVFSFVKKMLKLVCLVLITVIVAIYLAFASPSSLTGLFEGNITQLTDLSKESNLIDVDTENKSVKIKLIDTWVDVKDIDSIDSIDGDTCTFKVGDKSYTITDEGVSELLTLIQSQ